MKLGAALAILALAALTPSAPASAAKDEKLPRCSGRQKRPANLYGTVLPSIPPRNATSAAPADGEPRGTPPSQSAPATNLFPARSEEHTSELQSLMRISYAVFCLKKKTKKHTHTTLNTHTRYSTHHC